MNPGKSGMQRYVKLRSLYRKDGGVTGPTGGAGTAYNWNADSQAIYSTQPNWQAYVTFFSSAYPENAEGSRSPIPYTYVHFKAMYFCEVFWPADVTIS